MPWLVTLGVPAPVLMPGRYDTESTVTLVGIDSRNAKSTMPSNAMPCWVRGTSMSALETMMWKLSPGLTDSGWLTEVSAAMVWFCTGVPPSRAWQLRL